MEAWPLSNPNGERLGPQWLNSADLPNQRRKVYSLSGKHSVEAGTG